MPRFAEYFATILDGKIVAITSATPAQELYDNQIMLTEEEYKLLRAAHSFDRAKQLFASVEYKLKELGKKNDSSLQSE